jgi:lipopolysaccharide/colanic/teichoic acid biosynthesis glycosyltransferase
MKDFVAASLEATVSHETMKVPRIEKLGTPVKVGTSYSTIGKRLLDIAIVLTSMWILVPVILVCSAITMLDGKSPFFGHRRVGRDGVEFRCWKVRSMVADAEVRLAAHLKADPVARAEWEATRKLKNDPRITRFGRFIRKTSLDELPQILNVLLGTMSIVGPRPIVRDELTLYGRHTNSYLQLRPGITGLWQVSGRNEVSYDERVAFDREYNATLSFFRDIAIIWRTVRVVLARSGH